MCTHARSIFMLLRRRGDIKHRHQRVQCDICIREGYTVTHRHLLLGENIKEALAWVGEHTHEELFERI